MFCLLWLSILGLSQEKKNIFSLQEAIEIGMVNNKKLKISSVREEVSEIIERDLKHEKLPDINFHTGFSILSNIRQFEDGVFNTSTKYEVPRVQYDFTLSASIPIYMGGRLNHEERKAEINTEITELKTKKEARQLRMEIITGFLQVMHLRDQEELILEKMHEDSVNIKHIQALKENGVVTNNEVLRTKLQLSNHKMIFTTLENDISILEHQIKTLIAFPEHEEFHISTDGLLSTTGIEGKLEDLVTEAFVKNEALLISKKEIDLRKLDKKITKANQLPQIMGNGQYGYSYPNFMFFPPEAHLYRFGSIGISVNVPLSNLYKNKEKMALAQENVTIAKLEVEESEEQIRHDVYMAYRKLEEAVEKTKIGAEAIEQSKENYRIVKLKYANQLSLITELIDADNAYLEAQSNYISLEINKQLKYYQLQYILGNL